MLVLENSLADFYETFRTDIDLQRVIAIFLDVVIFSFRILMF